ncbi:prop effector [Allofranklinella schreckenbergeri]|uniref:Prop effector n=1 Tax=Allofranklinella schreckenbergeri TaxID=1076744 RepID=A0A3M6Q749_9BURK|nr:ProQ/FinO family protein [Allofranklinella schreckenbergeri]RMW98939.1 prop effector [Allofranklinella schreckenbergeri]
MSESPVAASPEEASPQNAPSHLESPALQPELAAKGKSARADVRPILQELAQKWPQLFGERPLPLKRGIFSDLAQTCPHIEVEALKQALGMHTRSTRYLQAIAAGQPRHDLQLHAVEDIAAEHVFHALTELYRRKLRRAERAAPAQQSAQQEQARQWLAKRLGLAMEHSALSVAEFVQAAHTRDAAIAALLQQVAEQQTQRGARDEAMLRAYEAGGVSLEDFAEMYGLSTREASAILTRARRLAAKQAPTATGADAAPASTAVSE